MSPGEKGVFITLRNQVLAIAIATCLGGLGMNMLFMFTINDTVNGLRQDNITLKQELKESDQKQTAKIEQLQDKFYQLEH